MGITFSYLLNHEWRPELCAAVQPEPPRGAVVPAEAHLQRLGRLGHLWLLGGGRRLIGGITQVRIRIQSTEHDTALLARWGSADD